MQQAVLPGDTPIEITLRRSSRARRITLRVSGFDARVSLTVPRGVPDREALDFARAKEGWIRAQLAKSAPQTHVGLGGRLPVEGEMHDIVPATGRRVHLSERQIAVPGPADEVGARLAGFLKARARARCAARADHYAEKLGRGYSGLSLRDTRSRWGSCSSHGRLMFSWRLIMAPAEVLDYVAAHEVAHLAEMNHSSRFWDLVRDLYGAYDAPRTWLRSNGTNLHRYRFETF